MRTAVASPSSYACPPTKPIGAVTTDQAEPSNPHRLKTEISTPRVPSLEASGRRPRSHAISVDGRHPKPITEADAGTKGLKVSIVAGS
jgi:hypothetical protein